MIRGRHAASLALTLSLLAPLGAASAAEPSSGTVSESSPSLTVTGGPFVVSNPSGLCADSSVSCDAFELTVELPAEYPDSHPEARIVIELQPDGSPTADFDLNVLNAEGDAVASSGNAPGESERVTLSPGGGTEVFTVQVIPFLVAGDSYTMTIELGEASSGEADPCAESGIENSEGALLGPGVAEALASLADGAIYGAFIHFTTGSDAAQNALFESLSLTIGADFREHANSVFVSGPAASFRALAVHPWIAYIEPNKTLRYLSDTATWASRIRTVQESVAGGPYYDGNGELIQGQGVTVAVVDSGTNVPHPDFQGRIAGNYKVVGNDAVTGEVIDLGPNVSSDTTGGHGTHCAGIALGSGAASTGDYPDDAAAPTLRGTYTGAAPQAHLLAYGAGETLVVLTASLSFQHILDHYDSFEPRLRVVSNSWGDGGGSSYNPADTHSCLTKALIEKGVSIVYAAGNDGGDGDVDQTSSYCKDPTPGVICVASYDDAGTGNTHHPLSGFSSRGKNGEPTSYPDIAAPGDEITAACAQLEPGQAVCTSGETNWAPDYGTISGTSMATPQVAGALALLYQAKPTLTPAQAELLLQNNARKVGNGYEADPQNPDGSTHHGFGAGLMNLQAAMDTLGVMHDGLPAAAVVTTIFDGDDDSLLTLDGAADVISLTMQETAAGVTPAGITYRLTIRDAADFTLASAVGYRVESNVAGRHVETSILSTPDGIEIPEAGDGNTAVAASASLDGNVLRFFVPYAQMGYPRADQPIHNIRVAVEDDVSGLVDLAPSPSATPMTLAELQPMFGRAATVLQQTPAPPSGEETCTAPGITMATSPAGTTGTSLGTGDDDLRRLWLSEPAELAGKLVFTLKVDNLATLPPAYRWLAYYKLPDDPNDYFAALDTSNGVAEFVYGTRGTIDTPVASVSTFETLGMLDAASSYDADGTIRLVLDKAEHGIESGDLISYVAASIRQSTSNQVNAAGLTVDSAAALYGYTVAGNDNCVSREEQTGENRDDDADDGSGDGDGDGDGDGGDDDGSGGNDGSGDGDDDTGDDDQDGDGNGNTGQGRSSGGGAFSGSGWLLLLCLPRLLRRLRGPRQVRRR